MKIKRHNLESYLKKTSNIFLILLFPVFAIYNAMVAYNIVPPILGGFYGIVTIIFLFLMLPSLISFSYFANNKTKLYSFLIIVFFSQLVFIASLNYFIYYSPVIELAFSQTIEALVFIISLIILGFYIKLDERLYFLLASFLVISLILISFYIFKTGEVLFYAKQLADESASESVSSYQGFARSAMIVSLIVLSMTNSISKYMIIFLLSMFILFFLGARSELVGVLLAALLLIPLKFKVSLIRIFQLVLLLLSIVFFIFWGYKKFQTNRIFQLLDISESSSWIARNELKQMAINQIKEHPLFGYFGGHLIEGGSVGSYSHNFLSVWAGFGFVAFLIYIMLCLIPVIDFSILALKSKNYSHKFYFCLGLSLAVFLLIATSKPLYWFMPGLVWGMYLNVKRDVYEN